MRVFIQEKSFLCISATSLMIGRKHIGDSCIELKGLQLMVPKFRSYKKRD